jgi:hypothetical protein
MSNGLGSKGFESWLEQVTTRQVREQEIGTMISITLRPLQI